MKRSFKSSFILGVTLFAVCFVKIASAHGKADLYKGKSKIAQLCLHLPDSCIMGFSQEERVSLLANGIAYGISAPDVLEGDALVIDRDDYMYYISDNVDYSWDMRCWDMSSPDKLLVVVHNSTPTEHYQYFYTYDLETKTFIYIEHLLPRIGIQHFTDKKYPDSVTAEFEKVANNASCQNYAGYDISCVEAAMRVSLSEMALVNGVVASVDEYNLTKVRSLYWDGETFQMEAGKPVKVNDIRKAYDKAKQLVKQQRETPGLCRKIEIRDGKNIPGIGLQTWNYVYYCNLEDKSPLFVTLKYNIGERNFNEEYLYNKGKLIYYFGCLPDMEDNMLELCCYFSEGKIVKTLVRKRTAGQKPCVIYDGNSVPLGYLSEYIDAMERNANIIDLYSHWK